MIVAIVVSSAVFATWFFFFRHWSIREVTSQVIDDPTPAAPGFKHSLAGKTVVVEGKVTNITTSATSIGQMTFVELDHFEEMNLVVWGSSDLRIGERVEMNVRFEWSVCNDEQHVYSPQLSFPNLFSIPTIERVLRSVNFVADGADLETTREDNRSVEVSVKHVRDPIPLEAANSTISNGHYSWAAEYVAMLGEPRFGDHLDILANLNRTDSESGMIHFTDADHDGFLDDGDFFTLNNLTIPATESGFKTYIFKIAWPRDPDWYYTTESGFALSYLPMTRAGLLRYNDTGTPVARIVRDPIPSGYEFTITKIEGTPLEWGNVVALMSPSTHAGEWTPSTDEMTGAPGISKTYSPVSSGNYSVVLRLTDAQGDGLMDEGDRFSITTEDSPFPNGTFASITLLSTLSDSTICMGQIPMNLTPTSRILTENVTAGVRMIFGPPHTGANVSFENFDVAWRDVVILISDGNNTLGWTLDSVIGVRPSLLPGTLGSITVACNISDIQGNGYINGCDSASFESTGGDGFSNSVVYTVSVIYGPSSSTLAGFSFSG